MRSETVLLVEDDMLVARFLMLVMRMWGYDATHASTSREAVDFAILHQNEITLVLCDVNLQGESGLSVAAKIRGLCPRSKTIFTSGFPLDVLCEGGLLTREVLQNGDTGYIKKPFLPGDLSNAIHSLLEPAAEVPWAASQTETRYASAAC
jgi:putative two-component system response regulator